MHSTYNFWRNSFWLRSEYVSLQANEMEWVWNSFWPEFINSPYQMYPIFRFTKFLVTFYELTHCMHFFLVWLTLVCLEERVVGFRCNRWDRKGCLWQTWETFGVRWGQGRTKASFSDASSSGTRTALLLPPLQEESCCPFEGPLRYLQIVYVVQSTGMFAG